MKGITKSAIVLSLAISFATGCTPSWAAETLSKTQRIEQLLELTNSGDMGIQVMDAMVLQFRQTLPEVPAEWWDRFQEKANSESINQMVVPIYERHFTDEEIDAMIAFYQTPEGQSIIAKMPVVLQESMMVGQMWGEDIARDIIRELQADGYEIPANPLR